MSKIETIYIELLDEGTECYRPVESERLGGELYRIVSEKPEDEVWPFSVGDTVKCRIRAFQFGGLRLLAYQKSN